MGQETFELLTQGRVTTLTDWDNLIGRSYDGTQLEATRAACSGRLERLRFGEIIIARISAAPHRVWRWRSGAPFRSSGVTYLHLQELGRSITRQRGEDTALHGGMAAFCDPNENYSIEFPEAYSVYLVEIPDVLLTQGAIRIVPRGPIGRGRAALLHGMLEQIFHQMPYLSKDADWAEGVHGALTSLLAHLAPLDEAVRPVEGVSSRMREAVLRTIEQRLTDPDLSVGALAQELGIARRSVQRVFAASALPVSAYILHRRLQLAAELLTGRSRGETITAIAMASGFADAAHFARCFRARFGKTPSVFRRTPSHSNTVVRSALSDLS